MRFPKTVQISGKRYSIKLDDSRWGGRCQTGKQEIGIGTQKNQSSQRKFANFVHEILEATSLERHLRYEAADGEMMFVMTHKQFDAYAKDIALSLWPMVKGT